MFNIRAGSQTGLTLITGATGFVDSGAVARQGLRQLSADTGMEVVIIRPPLVYGPGVKANFAALMRAVQRGCVLTQ